MNKPQPLVSVIINCYNGEAFLREAIDSVYAQTYKNWEIIFWDNASTDKSAEIAKAYDEKLRYFKAEVNVPLGEARNLALAKCQGDYITFLDCDDLYLERRLEEQIKAFDVHTDAGLIYTNQYIFDETSETLLYSNAKGLPQGHCFDSLLGRYILSIATVIIKRKALELLGEYFDPSLHVLEEADLFLRMANQYPIYYIDKPLAKYRRHVNNLTLKKAELFAPEMKRVLVKLGARIPDFQGKHKAAIFQCEAYIAYRKALVAMKKGEVRQVRSHLKGSRFVTKKSSVLYLFSFLGSALGRYFTTKLIWC